MTYNIDPKHSAAHFQVRHMTIAFVKGEFGNVNGTIEFDPANPAATKVDCTIEVASLYTRDPQRDGHIKTPDILDAEKHPMMTFKSTSASKAGSGYTVKGDLTLRGATKPVTLNVTGVSDEVKDPWNLMRRGATAHATIKRSEFGMGWNMDLPGVGPMVSDEVEVSLDIEFVRPA
jgi:polyisoprenoid-binding protein YceI